MNEIQKIFPTFKIGFQHDAPEFLMQLTRALEWNPTSSDAATVEKINDSETFPRLGKEYIHLLKLGYELEDQLPAGWGKGVFHENFKSMVVIDIPFKSKTIDVASLIEKPEHVSIKPDKLDQKAADITTIENKPFQAISHFTSLPDVVVIYLKRFHQNDGKEWRIDAPIQFEENHVITLSQFEIVTEKDGQTKMKSKEKHRYQVGASICHIGGESTVDGHYVCDERPISSKSLVRHSDKDLQSIQADDFSKLGYLVRLNKIVEKS